MHREIVGNVPHPRVSDARPPACAAAYGKDVGVEEMIAAVPAQRQVRLQRGIEEVPFSARRRGKCSRPSGGMSVRVPRPARASAQ